MAAVGLAALQLDQREWNSRSGSANTRKASRSRRLKAAVDSVDQLDVLLRHRLLPQPGGFEGLGLACGGCPTKRPSSRAIRRCARKSRPWALRSPRHGHDCSLRKSHVSKVSYFGDLRAVVAGDAEEVLQPAPDTVATAVGTPALQFQVAGDELQIGVDESEEGIDLVRLKASFAL